MTSSSGPPNGRPPHERAPSTLGPESQPPSPPSDAQHPAGENRRRLLAIAIPAAVALIAVALIALLIIGDRAPVEVRPRPGELAGGTPGEQLMGGGMAPLAPVGAAAPEGSPGRAQQPGRAGRPSASVEAESGGRATSASVTQSGDARGNLAGAWPRFRNSNFNATSTENVGLARTWPTGGPRKLWSIKMLGPGHGGAAILKGRVFVLDYDIGKREDVLRCLALADGSELWRTSYPVKIKDNHGISRTVPAVTSQYVLALGPLGHVTCARTDSGKVVWQADLVKSYGTKIPSWYTGQCPLIDEGRAIVAPGGSALMIAVDLATGRVLWQTPNPKKWQMTHASIVPIRLGGKRVFVYPASGGVVGVDARNGQLLWDYPGWTVNTANVPSPVDVGNDRIFLTGGYGAGSMMLSVKNNSPSQVWRIPQNVFGSQQHTPIFATGYLFGVAMDQQFVCLDLSGRRVWSSGHTATFGIGPYILAEGMFYVLSDDGTLVLAEQSTSGWHELARAQVLNGPDAWAPMALAGGRLVCRDRDTMVCLDVKNP